MRHFENSLTPQKERSNDLIQKLNPNVGNESPDSRQIPYNDGSANNRPNEILRLQIEAKRLEKQENLQKEKQYYKDIVERTQFERQNEERKIQEYKRKISQYGDDLKRQMQDQRASKLRQYEMSDQERRLNKSELNAYEQKDTNLMTSKMGMFEDHVMSQRSGPR